MKVDPEQGERAVTEWRVRDRYVGFGLLECIPRTFVPDQIRAHLEAAGMPLAVDPAYGGGKDVLLSSFKAGYRPSRRRPERPLIQRLSLHAEVLLFTHPVSGERLQFEVPPPHDLRAAIHQLGRFGRMPRVT
jgi:23S rRNA-/tRNA-specific pseudouridylate synthase